MRFVLDNSVAMRWLLQDGDAARLQYASDVLERLTQEDTQALVPAIWPLEVANVLVKAQTKGAVTEARCTAFVGLLQEMSIATDMRTAERALGDTLQLARRFALSAYDASYLELALREGVALATLDGQLRKAMTNVGVELLQKQ